MLNQVARWRAIEGVRRAISGPAAVGALAIGNNDKINPRRRAVNSSLCAAQEKILRMRRYIPLAAQPQAFHDQLQVGPDFALLGGVLQDFLQAPGGDRRDLARAHPAAAKFAEGGGALRQ